MRSAVVRKARCPDIDLTRLWTAAPLTVGAVVAAVIAVRSLAMATLRPAPQIAPLIWSAPVLVPLVLVAGAVLAFLVVVMTAADPVKTYRRVAFALIVLSSCADLPLPRLGEWALWMANILTISTHAVAWWITVKLLTSLSQPTRRDRFARARS